MSLFLDCKESCDKVEWKPVITGDSVHCERLLSLKGGEIKISLFVDVMILYLKDPKNSNQKLLDTINSYSKVAGHKINIEKSWTFLYTNNEQTEKEFMKTIPFIIASKKSNT
jgi:hypothetical protein